MSSNNMHFTHQDFTISYSTQNSCILLIISMLIGPYITSLCRTCLIIIGKSLGIMGGISGKFPRNFWKSLGNYCVMPNSVLAFNVSFINLLM